MENNNKILNELREISPFLVQLENKSPYSVAGSYFSHLAETIVEKIRSGIEPSYYFTKETPYVVPAGYFSNLSVTILRKIEEQEAKMSVFDEMEQISPLLNTISKKPVYTVPNGFLEKAEWNKGLVNKPKARVVSFNQGKKGFAYVAAAIIIGLLAVGIFLFTGKQDSNVQADTVKALSEVKTLSEQEIVDFLKTSSPGANFASNGSSTNTKDGDIRSVIREMSDKEIQQFLAENGEQDEM